MVQRLILILGTKTLSSILAKITKIKNSSWKNQLAILVTMKVCYKEMSKMRKKVNLST